MLNSDLHAASNPDIRSDITVLSDHAVDCERLLQDKKNSKTWIPAI